MSDFFVHDSSYIDEDVTIGNGTKIWFFCHIISQSGETADSLAALRSAKEQGIRTLGIVNVVGSSIAREADNVFYTLAGPEISVATTKAYSTQLIAGYLLALQFAKARVEITDERYTELISEINSIPSKIEKILSDKERIQWFSSKLVGIKDAFFISTLKKVRSRSVKRLMLFVRMTEAVSQSSTTS